MIKQNPKYDWEDLGVHNTEKTDYPLSAQKLCRHIQNQEGVYGVLVCASGQGMNITANRFYGIRASLCWSKESAYLARAHNNAQVLCLGARLLPPKMSHQILKVFMETEFMGGRHLNRIKLIDSKTSKLKLSKKGP